jgi:6-pyruvoyltetrahydropterin/6-carboxytetrahydropterin synthase
VLREPSAPATRRRAIGDSRRAIERKRGVGARARRPRYIAPRMSVPVFEISKEFLFSAAHQIRHHGGKCERLHGHNYRVRVHARASQLNAIGMVIDFADLQRMVSEVGSRFDHRNMNEIPPFDEVNTTAELVARYFYAEMNARLAVAEGERVRVSKVDVWENEGSLAVYREE